MTPGDERLARLLALHDAATGPAVLRDLPRRRITRLEVDGASIVAKEYRTPGLRQRLAAALLGPRAARADRAARLLLDAGLLAPEPLGWLAEPHRSVAFARRVDGPTLQEALARADRRGARDLAVAAATLAARLHLAGLAVRDLKPPNLVVTDRGPCLVDLDDVGRAGLRTRHAWRRNLVSLDAYAQAPPRPLGVGARLAALRAYAALCGVDPAQVLREVLPRSRRKRRAVLARPSSRS